MSAVPFTPGQPLWWLITGYGWKRRVPVSFRSTSKSAKRCYVSVHCADGSTLSTFVTPRKLIERLATDGEPVKL